MKEERQDNHGKTSRGRTGREGKHKGTRTKRRRLEQEHPNQCIFMFRMPSHSPRHHHRHDVCLFDRKAAMCMCKLHVQTARHVYGSIQCILACQNAQCSFVSYGPKPSYLLRESILGMLYIPSSALVSCLSLRNRPDQEAHRHDTSTATCCHTTG